MLSAVLVSLASLLVLALLAAVAAFFLVRMHRELVMHLFRVHRAKLAISDFEDETQEQTELTRLRLTELHEERNQAEMKLEQRCENPVARALLRWMDLGAR